MSAVDNKNSEEIAKPQCSSGNCDGTDLLSLQERSIKDDSLPPKPKKLKRNLTLKYEQVYLRAIPKASQYEKSFMHRDTITHVLATELYLFF
uniref:Uncharacterized protein n=1 Tax=Meloidogyne hapla TaxID=6305 RepID=A0A1I8BKP7_MELHA